jgi:hypothetical protein
MSSKCSNEALERADRVLEPVDQHSRPAGELERIRDAGSIPATSTFGSTMRLSETVD